MNTSYVNHSTKTHIEDQLLRQAVSGNIKAFLQIYDSFIEYVYRYVFFQVRNDVAANVVTVRVFFKAWEKIGRYKISRAPFAAWLYLLARNEIDVYYQTHKKNVSELNKSILPGKDSRVHEEILDIFNIQALRDGLQLLSEEEEQILILRFVLGLTSKKTSRIMSVREDDIFVLQAPRFAVYGAAIRENGAKEDHEKDFLWNLENCLTILSNNTSALNECLTLYPNQSERLNRCWKPRFLLAAEAR